MINSPAARMCLTILSGKRVQSKDTILYYVTERSAGCYNEKDPSVHEGPFYSTGLQHNLCSSRVSRAVVSNRPDLCSGQCRVRSRSVVSPAIDLQRIRSCFAFFDEGAGGIGDYYLHFRHHKVVGCFHCDGVANCSMIIDDVNNAYFRRDKVISHRYDVSRALLAGDPFAIHLLGFSQPDLLAWIL